MLPCLGFSICEIRTKSSSTYRVVLRFRCHSVYENALCKYDYVISGFIKGWDFLCVCVHVCVCVCVCMRVLSCVWLFVTPMDCSAPGSSVHGTSKARILECGLPFPSPGESFRPRDWISIFHFLHWQVDSLSLCHLGSPDFIVYTRLQWYTHPWIGRYVELSMWYPFITDN